MKPSSYKIFLCISVFILLIPRGLQSQSMNNKFWRPYNWFVGVNGGFSQTTLLNSFKSDISEVDLIKKNSFLLSVEAGYSFSKNFGISTGLGLSPYLAQLSLNDYSSSFNTTDSENETYERRIVGSNIKEDQRIYFLSIPLMFTFSLPVTRTNGLFIGSGVNVSIPVIKSFSTSGIFSYSGYYPAYNVTFTDIPYEGFKSNVNSEVEGDLRIKSINPELVATGGYYFYPSSRYKISLGILYKRIFTDLSDYSEESPFQLSVQENQIKSLMENNEKTNASSIGLVISLKYYIK